MDTTELYIERLSVPASPTQHPSRTRLLAVGDRLRRIHPRPVPRSTAQTRDTLYVGCSNNTVRCLCLSFSIVPRTLPHQQPRCMTIPCLIELLLWGIQAASNFLFYINLCLRFLPFPLDTVLEGALLCQRIKTCTDTVWTIPKTCVLCTRALRHKCMQNLPCLWRQDETPGTVSRDTVHITL